MGQKRIFLCVNIKEGCGSTGGLIPSSPSLHVLGKKPSLKLPPAVSECGEKAF